MGSPGAATSSTFVLRTVVPSLFDSFRLRGIELRNRVAMSPMVQASAVDGYATDWHLVHLGARAIGSVGLVMAEATAVAPDARVTINDLGLWRDEHIPGLRRITDFLHREGAVAGIQLAHAGRKSNYTPPFDRHGMQPMRQLTAKEGGWRPRAASPVRYSPYSSVPLEMSREEVGRACRQHAEAAKRAVEAGFDWVEIHAAHGYLPHCFYSPLSNRRTDEYGGSFENRIRLSREIARAVRAVMPADRVLAFRVSYTDWIEGGWTLDETIELASLLQEDGVDLIDVSSGGTTPTAMMLQLTEEMTEEPARHGSTEDLVARIPVGPGYQVAAAAAIRRRTGLPVAAVGLIHEPDQADRIIRQGEADIVMLGRVLLREPNWVQRAAVELADTVRARVPVQYYLAWRDRGEFTHEPVSAPCLAETATASLTHSRIDLCKEQPHMPIADLLRMARHYARFTPSYSKIGFYARRVSWGLSRPLDFAGQRWIVTGANSGIGKAMMHAASMAGASIVAVARNRERLQAAISELPDEAAERITPVIADMSLQRETAGLLEKLVSDGEGTDVLMNNVGVLLNEHTMTEEGREKSFATNVLSHFQLTEGLLEADRLNAGATVVNMSSGGMYNVPLATTGLNVKDPSNHNGKVAYAFAKRAQVALTDYWNHVYADRGIRVYVTHPGYSKTPGVKFSLPVFWKIQNVLLRSPLQGADTALWLAVQRPDVIEDVIWFDRKPRPTHIFEHTRQPQCTIEELVEYLRAELELQQGSGKFGTLLLPGGARHAKARRG